MSVQVLPRAVRTFTPRFLLLILAFALVGGFASASQVKNATAGDAVELTYTKWFSPAFPHMKGIVGGDIVGSFGGEVLTISTPGNGRFTYITARYDIMASDPSQSFSAVVEGRQDNSKGRASLSGVVTTGWLAGERVHAEYRVLTSCAGSPSGPCFQGTIRVTGESHSDDSAQVLQSSLEDGFGRASRVQSAYLGGTLEGSA